VSGIRNEPKFKEIMGRMNFPPQIDNILVGLVSPSGANYSSATFHRHLTEEDRADWH
jgi:hypothetical protein